jgi:hypothetical protein
MYNGETESDHSGSVIGKWPEYLGLSAGADRVVLKRDIYS